MKKTLYKPQTDDLDVNVAVYANEAWFNLRRCTDNPSECGKRWPNPKKDINLFFCKKGKDNQACPID